MPQSGASLTDDANSVIYERNMFIIHATEPKTPKWLYQFNGYFWTLLYWRHAIWHDGTKHNNIQHNDIQHNDTQHNDTSCGLFSSPKCHYAECHSAECRYVLCHSDECRGASLPYSGILVISLGAVQSSQDYLRTRTTFYDRTYAHVN